MAGVFNPLPGGPLFNLLEMSPSSKTPDSNDQDRYQASTKLADESGVLEEGEMENVPQRGSRGPNLGKPAFWVCLAQTVPAKLAHCINALGQLLVHPQKCVVERPLST